MNELEQQQMQQRETEEAMQERHKEAQAVAATAVQEVNEAKTQVCLHLRGSYA